MTSSHTTQHPLHPPPAAPALREKSADEAEELGRADLAAEHGADFAAAFTAALAAALTEGWWRGAIGPCTRVMSPRCRALTICVAAAPSGGHVVWVLRGWAQERELPEAGRAERVGGTPEDVASAAWWLAQEAAR